MIEFIAKFPNLLAVIDERMKAASRSEVRNQIVLGVLVAHKVDNTKHTVTPLKYMTSAKRSTKLARGYRERNSL